MKVLISTIVDNINFGTYLQSFALAHTIRRKGAEAVVLNYSRSYLSGKDYAKSYLHDRTKSLPVRCAYFLGYGMLNKYMIWNVKRFLTKRIPLTQRFEEWPQMRDSVQGHYDLFLTGSDQVWNAQYNSGVDPVFFWGGIDAPKASYAASLGLDHFPAECQDEVRAYLSEYSDISVRESSAIDALAEIGVKGAVHVVDPTFLLQKTEWSHIAETDGFKKTEPYLLVYSVETGQNNKVIKLAKQLAEQRGLAVYVVCPTLKFRKKMGVDRVFSFASVERFLNLMSQADYVVVSSFHGTAFAINFEKQFVTVAPERFSARVNSLLSSLGIEDRYTDGNSAPSGDIDYSPVSAVLAEMRKSSLEFIDRVLHKHR